jgi:hypothetical protein
MALYLGNSEKLKFNLSGAVYNLNLFSTTPITNGVRLLSSDNYILKDSNGIYLTTKEKG